MNFDKFTIELHFLLIMAPISLNIYICIYIYKSSILLCFLKDKYIFFDLSNHIIEFNGQRLAPNQLGASSSYILGDDL